METEAEMNPEERDAISAAWHHRARLSEVVASTSLTLTRLKVTAVGVQTGAALVMFISWAALAFLIASFSPSALASAHAFRITLVRWIVAGILVAAILLFTYLVARLLTLRRITGFGHQQVLDSERILSNIDQELLDIPKGAPGYYGKEDA